MIAGPEENRNTRPLRLGLLGATLETGNLGVSALALSTIAGLVRTGRTIELSLFDRAPGTRHDFVETPDGRIPVRRVGMYYSRRFHSWNNLQQCFVAAHAKLGRLHPTLLQLRALDGVLDVSGGDSFTDLYGNRRFRAQTYSKRIPLALGVPLVLLPQTYGPFHRPVHAAIAKRILISSRQVWTRDLRGLSRLQGLLGAHFDPARHRSGVDLAFGLSPLKPADPSLPQMVFAERQRADLLLGLNVSGLLYSEPHSSSERLGIRSSYRAVMQRLLSRLLQIPGTRVLLVSHVQNTSYAEGGDFDACRALRESLSSEDAERVTVLPHVEHPANLKWVFEFCDWFCGTRMHACIGALSQGVPTVALAYSDKTLGVLEMVGAGDWVFDLRVLTEEQLVELVSTTLERRKEMATTLAERLPSVQQLLRSQFHEIVQILDGKRETSLR